MNNDILSPLRYPGSKYVLADYFDTVVKENLLAGCHFYEPYAGGASISLCLLSRNTVDRATLLERDPLVYAFWKAVVQMPDELCRRIERLEVSLRTWKRFQKYASEDALARFELIDLAVAGLFFNRTNFSGIIGAKPIGGMSQESIYTIDCRFNKAAIVARIEAVDRVRGRLTVGHGNAIGYLRRNHDRIRAKHSLVYVDPPYVKFGPKLYRYHYQERDHRSLAEFMDSAGFNWIVSYDNEPFIRRLFKNQTIVPIFLNYAVKMSRKAEELLISNIRLIQPEYGEPARRHRESPDRISMGGR